MRRTAEDTAKTREKILDISLKVFGQKGYTATKLSDIAKESGITRGAIYHHFNSKPELFAALIDRYQTRINNALIPILNKEKNAVEKLKLGMHAFFNLLENGEGMMEFQKIQFMEKEVLYSLNEFEKVRSYSKQQLKDLQDTLLIGKENGEVKQNVNVEEFIFFLTSFIAGIINQWMFFDKPFSLPEVGFKYLDSFIEQHLRPE